jgi:hypothetical protein
LKRSIVEAVSFMHMLNTNLLCTCTYAFVCLSFLFL